jgi:hypothetical protein
MQRHANRNKRKSAYLVITTFVQRSYSYGLKVDQWKCYKQLFYFSTTVNLPGNEVSEGLPGGATCASTTVSTDGRHGTDVVSCWGRGGGVQK